MPLKNGRLSPKEYVFAREFAKSGDATGAARKAGYAVPSVSGSQAQRRPAIAAEVARIQMERIATEILPLAVDVHLKLLRDKSTPAGAKTQAVKLAYDYAKQNGLEEKQPHEMSAEEIADRIERLHREKSDRARPVIEGEARPAGGLFD